jgi:hypothetical protein
MLVFTLKFCRQKFYRQIYGWKPFVGNVISVNKKNTDDFIDKKYVQKKFTCFNTLMRLFRRWFVVAFIVILFQPSIKNRRNYSVCDIIVMLWHMK